MDSNEALTFERCVLRQDLLGVVLLRVGGHLHGVGPLVVLLLHLLLLHPVHVVHDHLFLRLSHFLRVDRLLGRVLRLLHVHFLVLACARGFAPLRALQGRGALFYQVRMARVFALRRPTDCDCWLVLTRA